MGRIGTPALTEPFAFVLLTLVRYAVFGVLGTVRSYDQSGHDLGAMTGQENTQAIAT
jgi:hypothetical protein